MDFGGSSVSGPRPYNEDNYLILDLSEHKRALSGLTAFILISDGMGGHQSGDVASRVAVEAADAYMRDLIGMAQQSHIKLDVAQALREIADEAHQAVLRAAEENGASSMGATFVAAFMSGRKAWVGHVGDSRAYLLHDGAATQVTIDHSQVGRMIAEGILTEEQAQHHPQRNVIERALGFEGSSAEINEVEIRSGDAVVLCSDGLSTVLSAPDIAQIAVSSDSAEAAARQLTAEAITAGTDDNTTVVLACDDWALLRMSAPQLKQSRRETSRARREAMKHKRASRTSWYIAGAVVLVGVVALAIAMGSASGPAGGGGKAQPVPRLSQFVGTREPSSSPAPVVPPEEVTRVVVANENEPGGVILRAEPLDQKKAELGTLRGKTELRSVGIATTSDGKTYYRFVAAEIEDASFESDAKPPSAWQTTYPEVYSLTANFEPASD